ncbi:MAG: AraC family transcriptional regulator [Myxococcota bacterium]|nr:AraC family transcriptional regulator [Myxococcota bacterium]
MRTVGAGQVLQLLDGLERMGAGLERAELCEAAGLDPSELDRPGARTPLAAYERLALEAERRSGDPLACLHAAEASGARGMLSYLAQAQPTLEEALERFRQFAALAGDDFGIELSRGPTHATLRVDVQSQRDEVAAPLRENAVGLIVLGLRAATSPGVRPSEVRFPHARRGPAGEVERVLGAPVRYGQPRCEIVLPADALDRRLTRANLQIARLLETEASEQLALAAARDVAGRAAEAARRELRAGGDPAPESVARTLGLSVRTLQRRLREESTSFRAVRDAVRCELAEAWLADASLSISQVAERLGFSDVASFDKAFKRWTGEVPRAFRRRSGGARERRV